jgi:hypothetical protein
LYLERKIGPLQGFDATRLPDGLCEQKTLILFKFSILMSFCFFPFSDRNLPFHYSSSSPTLFESFFCNIHSPYWSFSQPKSETHVDRCFFIQAKVFFIQATSAEDAHAPRSSLSASVSQNVHYPLNRALSGADTRLLTSRSYDTSFSHAGLPGHYQETFDGYSDASGWSGISRPTELREVGATFGDKGAFTSLRNRPENFHSEPSGWTGSQVDRMNYVPYPRDATTGPVMAPALRTTHDYVEGSAKRNNNSNYYSSPSGSFASYYPGINRFSQPPPRPQ